MIIVHTTQVIILIVTLLKAFDDRRADVPIEPVLRLNPYTFLGNVQDPGGATCRTPLV